MLTHFLACLENRFKIFLSTLHTVPAATIDVNSGVASIAKASVPRLGTVIQSSNYVKRIISDYGY